MADRIQGRTEGIARAYAAQRWRDSIPFSTPDRASGMRRVIIGLTNGIEAPTRHRPEQENFARTANSF